MTEYIHSQLKVLIKFARNNNVHVFLVAHPTKLQKGNDGMYPVPAPYDIAGSAGFRDKSDNCLAIWINQSRTNTDYEVEVHVQKVKHKHYGKIGCATMYYEYSTGIYHEHPICRYQG